MSYALRARADNARTDFVPVDTDRRLNLLWVGLNILLCEGHSPQSREQMVSDGAVPDHRGPKGRDETSPVLIVFCAHILSQIRNGELFEQSGCYSVCFAHLVGIEVYVGLDDDIDKRPPPRTGRWELKEVAEEKYREAAKWLVVATEHLPESHVALK